MITYTIFYGFQFKVASFAVIAGAWMRYFIIKETDNFGLVLIPQFICALSDPFFYNGLSKITCVWFGDG